MQTDIHFLSYLAQFYLEWEIFSHKSYTENQNTHFVFNDIFPKIVPFMG